MEYTYEEELKEIKRARLYLKFNEEKLDIIAKAIQKQIEQDMPDFKKPERRLAFILDTVANMREDPYKVTNIDQLAISPIGKKMIGDIYKTELPVDKQKVLDDLTPEVLKEIGERRRQSVFSNEGWSFPRLMDEKTTEVMSAHEKNFPDQTLRFSDKIGIKNLMDGTWYHVDIAEYHEDKSIPETRKTLTDVTRIKMEEDWATKIESQLQDKMGAANVKDALKQEIRQIVNAMDVSFGSTKSYDKALLIANEMGIIDQEKYPYMSAYVMIMEKEKNIEPKKYDNEIEKFEKIGERMVAKNHAHQERIEQMSSLKQELADMIFEPQYSEQKLEDIFKYSFEMIKPLQDKIYETEKSTIDRLNIGITQDLVSIQQNTQLGILHMPDISYDQFEKMEQDGVITLDTPTGHAKISKVETVHGESEFLTLGMLPNGQGIMITNLDSVEKVQGLREAIVPEQDLITVEKMQGTYVDANDMLKNSNWTPQTMLEQNERYNNSQDENVFEQSL